MRCAKGIPLSVLLIVGIFTLWLCFRGGIMLGIPFARTGRPAATGKAVRRACLTRATVFPWLNSAGKVTIEPASRRQLMPLSSDSCVDDVAFLCTNAIFNPESQRLSREIEKYLFRKIIDRYGPSNDNKNRLVLALESLPDPNQRARLIGCVGLEVVEVTQDGKPKGDDIQPRPLLEFLAVDPSARGRGLGKQLLRQCEDIAREWGHDEIVLQVAADNEVAIGLYKKLGYSVIAEDNTILRPKEGGILEACDSSRPSTCV